MAVGSTEEKDVLNKRDKMKHLKKFFSISQQKYVNKVCHL